LSNVTVSDPQYSADGKPAGRLLEVDDLYVEFRTRDGVAKVINGVSYHVNAGETLAVLGESGSGKSVTAQTIMGILDMPPGFVAGGEIRFHGDDMLKMNAEQRRKIRGKGIAMVFQDALSALNPVFTVGFQIGEQFRIRQGMSRRDAKRRAIEMLDQVKIPHAKQRVSEFPHQFSGA
jgi:oligopeptide transport system ATP-binding protein